MDVVAVCISPWQNEGVLQGSLSRIAAFQAGPGTEIGGFLNRASGFNPWSEAAIGRPTDPNGQCCAD